VPFTLVHAGKYRTEDKTKTDTLQKLNTTQKKQTTQNTAEQNYPGLVASNDTRPGKEVGLFYKAHVVTLCWARLVLGWVTHLWKGKPSQYVTSHLGQLSLPSLQVVKFRTSLHWLGLGGVRSLASNIVWALTVGDVLQHKASSLDDSTVWFNKTRNQAVARTADRTASQPHLGHVTSLVTWPFDSPYAISYWWFFETKSLTVSKIFNVECNTMVDMTLIRPLNEGQGHSFWYQSNSHIRLPIGSQ